MLASILNKANIIFNAWDDTHNDDWIMVYGLSVRIELTIPCFSMLNSSENSFNSIILIQLRKSWFYKFHLGLGYLDKEFSTI